MLVLTRRLGEALVIGENVIVTVLEVRGEQVRIGIDAPREVAVHREEVFQAVQRANTDAVANAQRIARTLRQRGVGGSERPSPPAD